MTGVSYKDAGVDREVAEAAKNRIKDLAKESHSRNVLHGIGLFSGFYELDLSQYRQPILVSSIDGIGTKVKVAQASGIYRSLGHDLVNHCINDIMVSGADPLFFLDYFAAATLDEGIVHEIMRGLAKACKAAECSLIGGETAEMPGVYTAKHFDVAGAIVGIVEKDAIIDGSSIESGDVVIGIASNGLHTNGYSLARKVLFEDREFECDQHFQELGQTLGEALMQPHLSYRKLIRSVRGLEGLHGIAHITGGGMIANISRLLRGSLAVQIDWEAWQRPAIFGLLREAGNIDEVEMREVFNCGIGLALIVAADNVEACLELCERAEHKSYQIGSISLQ